MVLACFWCWFWYYQYESNDSALWSSLQQEDANLSCEYFKVPDPPPIDVLNIISPRQSNKNPAAIVSAIIYSCDRLYKLTKRRRLLTSTGTPIVYPRGYSDRKSFLWSRDSEQSTISEDISEASVGDSDYSCHSVNESDVFFSPHHNLSALSYAEVSLITD